MKRLLIAIVFLCCSFYAIAAAPGRSLSQDFKSPAIEIAELETLIAQAKAAGQTPDPAWTDRVKELVPLVKSHPGDAVYDLQAFRAIGGFAPGAVIRPTELTQLEAQIKELENQIDGGESAIELDEVLYMNLKDQLNELYAQREVRNPADPLDQGADACPATAISGLPYTDSGSTVGLANNYTELDPACVNSSNAADVIYSFVPPATQSYTINTEGSLYDTYLYINTTGACPGTVHVACDDDNGTGVLSSITTVLTAGVTYYIIVDGYNTSTGNYVLNVFDNCNIECQPGDVQECAGEVIAPSHTSSDCNGACNNTVGGGVATWQDIQPCQTVCGRVFTYVAPNGSSARDTDFYRFTLTEPCSLRLTLSGEVALATVIRSTTGTCPPGTAWFNQTWAYPCSTVTFLTACLQPGTYQWFIGPNAFSGSNAFRSYRARMDLVPCSGCKIDAFVQAPGTGAWHTCGADNDNNLRPSEDYTFCVNVPYESDWTFSTCNDDSIWDSYIYLSGTCNGNVYMQDDDACGGVGLSVIRCAHLTAGNYYLTVEGFSGGNCGPFVLNVAECLGACCYGDPSNPGCIQLTQFVCDSLGGVWTEMEPCSSGACFTRPTCLDNQPMFSQLPSLPDEPWDAYLSDLDNSWVDYEDFSVSGLAIGSITFWGVNASCAPGPHSFQITFVDSVNNVTQVYNVTLTGTVLDPLYLGAFRLTEYFTQLSPPCTISNGYVSVAETGNPDCPFYWSWTNLGNGVNALAGLVGGPFSATTAELAFCLGGICQKIDSVTMKWEGPSADQFRMDWYVPQFGYVRLYSTTNPNDVFPTGYTVITQGTIPAGHFVWLPSYVDPNQIFVLTIECGGGPAIQVPDANLPFRRIE